MVELVHKTQVLVAQSPLLLCTLNPESVAQQLDLTGTGCIQAAKQVQQRALARPRRPHNRQRLATVHLQVHLLQHRHIQAPFLKPLGQTTGLQHQLHRFPPAR